MAKDMKTWPEDARTGLDARAPWAAVLLLMVVQHLNLVDRMLPAILAEPIKHDLGLSDTFLGVINGVGFLAVYAVAAIPIARIADKGLYGSVISASLGLWSAMTALAGVVAVGWQLAITRAGVAIGEAGSVPAGQAYVSRNFAPKLRPKVLAVISVGHSLGGPVAFFVGGILGEAIGWRNTFLLMGVIGMLLAPFVIVVLGRAQAPPSVGVARGFAGATGELRKPTVIAIFAAVAAIAVGGNAAAAFGPAYLMRVQGMSLSELGLKLGLISAVIGSGGVLGVSWLGAQLAGRDPRWSLWVLAAVAILCAPFGWIAWMAHDANTAMVGIIISTLAGQIYTALTVACLHSLVSSHIRAQASAVLLFWAGVAGGCGPLIVGMISDALTPSYGVAALGRALLLQPVAFVLGGILYLIATITLRRDIVEEGAKGG